MEMNVAGGAAAQSPEVPDPTQPVPQGDENSWQRNDFLRQHAAFCAMAQAGGIDVIFLGDSIVQGWAGDSKAIWEQRYQPLHAANFGYSGDQTQNLLWRLQNGELQGISPKVVVVLIGTNNFLTAMTDQGVAAGVAAIVKTLRQKLPQSKILLLGIFPRDEKPGATRDHIQRINAITARLEDGKFVRYMDIGEKFLQPDQTIFKEVMPDFLHLTTKGYEIWAAAMQATLDAMMK